MYNGKNKRKFRKTIEGKCQIFDSVNHARMKPVSGQYTLHRHEKLAKIEYINR